LYDFPEAAGAVADDGQVLVSYRGAAGLAWVDGDTLETRCVHATAPRPNGVAIVSHSQLAIVACIGDESHGPELQTLVLGRSQRWSVALSGRPRWCVTNREGTKVFLAICEPSSGLRMPVVCVQIILQSHPCTATVRERRPEH
jgi:hypothetical protein